MSTYDINWQQTDSGASQHPGQSHNNVWPRTQPIHYTARPADGQYQQQGQVYSGAGGQYGQYGALQSAQPEEPRLWDNMQSAGAEQQSKYFEGQRNPGSTWPQNQQYQHASVQPTDNQYQQQRQIHPGGQYEQHAAYKVGQGTLPMTNPQGAIVGQRVQDQVQARNIKASDGRVFVEQSYVRTWTILSELGTGAGIERSIQSSGAEQQSQYPQECVQPRHIVTTDDQPSVMEYGGTPSTGAPGLEAAGAGVRRSRRVTSGRFQLEGEDGEEDGGEDSEDTSSEYMYQSEEESEDSD